jgi:hypothetical protein
LVLPKYRSQETLVKKKKDQSGNTPTNINNKKATRIEELFRENSSLSVTGIKI